MSAPVGRQQTARHTEEPTPPPGGRRVLLTRQDSFAPVPPHLPTSAPRGLTRRAHGGRRRLPAELAFFGGWRPQYILAGSAFFAAMEVLAQRAQVTGVGIPHQFVSMLPYVATLLVMGFAFRWALVPQFLGKNYDRESRIVG